MSNKTSVSDKVCLVTGGTSGIGLETALALAKMGATVVVVGRNQAKTEAVVDQIKRDSGNDAVSFLIADFASQTSIRHLANAFLARHDRLDVLVNNAGLVVNDHVLTIDGVETTFAVNHLAPFLLTNLLLDRLKASAPSRIVTVSSGAQAMGQLNFDDLNGTKKFNGFRAYCQSKLANILFTYELAEQLKETGVTANCLHPGVISTSLGRNNGDNFLFRTMILLSTPFALTSEQGALTNIYLASSPQVEGITGKYFIKRKAATSSKISYDKAVQKRLWEVSEELTKLHS